MNWFSSDGGPGQMHKMSSMYRFHNSGFIGYIVERGVGSSGSTVDRTGGPLAL